MAHTITRDRQGYHVTYSGPVTFAEFLRVTLALHAHEDYDTIAHVIHDLSAVHALDLSEANLTALMSHELGARFTNPHIRAAIVSRDPDMASLIQTFNARTRLNMGVFPSVQEAKHEIGLQPNRDGR